MNGSSDRPQKFVPLALLESIVGYNHRRLSQRVYGMDGCGMPVGRNIDVGFVPGNAGFFQARLLRDSPALGH